MTEVAPKADAIAEAFVGGGSASLPQSRSRFAE
jgi:hypothetical protein